MFYFIDVAKQLHQFGMIDMILISASILNAHYGVALSALKGERRNNVRKK